MRYGKIVDGRLEIAAESREIDGVFYTKLSREQHLALGEKPVYETLPFSAAPEGKEWTQDGWTEQAGGLVSKWKLVDAPEPDPELVMVSKAKVEATVDGMGKTAQFMAWLQSKASYFGGWMRSGDRIEYDPEDNASDLASLVAALGIPAADVPGLIEEVRA